MEQPEIDKLGQINSELCELCQWLNEQHDIQTAARLIPIVEKLTHLFIEITERKPEALKEPSEAKK